MIETEIVAAEAAPTQAQLEKEQEEKKGFVHVPVGTEETMEDYSRELEASFRQIRTGDILKGTVIAVSEEAVTLDLNYYAPGVIKAEDMSRDPRFSVMNDVKVGDVVEATVVKKDDGAGNIVLSCVDASDVLGWDRLIAWMENKTVVPVKISEVVNKGVVAFIEGIRGFIPASQLSLSYVEEKDLPNFVGQVVDVQVITVEKERKKVVLSAKGVLREKEEERVRHQIAMLTPGTVLSGKVESLQPYGAFVDLGNGMTGLVHVSQISEKRIRKPSEVLSVGQEVSVKVLQVKDGKISLSMKEAAESAAAAEKEEEEKEEREAVREYNAGPEISTSLGALLKGLKL